jgi:hypothetical protein
MSVPGVDTFEHDIADELRQKDASITSIAAAGTEIGNKPEGSAVLQGVEHVHMPVLLLIVGVLIVCAILGIGAMGYLYSTGVFDPFSQTPKASELRVPVPPPVKQVSGLHALSPALESSIGSYITDFQKQKSGYSMKLNSFGPVFSYVTRNEDVYMPELALSLGTQKPSTGTVPKVSLLATGTPSIIQGGTSTKGTTTVATGTVVTEEPVAPHYTDVTLNDQNMRVWTDGTVTVVYAFIDARYFLISGSTSGILELRSAILSK